jgi:hypothetical protein
VIEPVEGGVTPARAAIARRYLGAHDGERFAAEVIHLRQHRPDRACGFRAGQLSLLGLASDSLSDAL